MQKVIIAARCQKSIDQLKVPPIPVITHLIHESELNYTPKFKW